MPMVDRVDMTSCDRDRDTDTPRTTTALCPSTNLLIRRSGQLVQDRPSPVVGWADIPELSTCVGRCPAAWQQCWQQSRRNGADPRPSAFQAGRIPSWPRDVRAFCAVWQSPRSVETSSYLILVIFRPVGVIERQFILHRRSLVWVSAPRVRRGRPWPARSSCLQGPQRLRCPGRPQAVAQRCAAPLTLEGRPRSVRGAPGNERRRKPPPSCSCRPRTAGSPRFTRRPLRPGPARRRPGRSCPAPSASGRGCSPRSTPRPRPARPPCPGTAPGGAARTPAWSARTR